MTRLTIALDPPLLQVQVDELGRRILFAASEIRDFSFVIQSGSATAVHLELSSSGDPYRIERQVRAIIDNDIRPLLACLPRVIWSSTPAAQPPTDMFPRLVQEGEAYEVGAGQVALGPRLLRLIDALDDVLANIARTAFAATDYRYPTLLPTTALARCGYFTSFPQYAMFTARLHTDYDVYRQFAEDVRATGGLVPDVLSRCGEVDYCLPPTMCYHTFHQFADRTLPNDVRTVTARGKSFRHEEKYHRGLERLWDFTIRETVFFGSREEVLQQRRQFLDRTLGLMEELGLAGRCEIANDVFFGNETVARSFSQRLLEFKYELRLNVGGGRDIAVGSFNVHDQLFGDAFGIALPDGTTTHSACVGFGLERLAYALVCQFGLDEPWPPHVIAVLGPAAVPAGGRIESSPSPDEPGRSLWS